MKKKGLGILLAVLLVVAILGPQIASVGAIGSTAADYYAAGMSGAEWIADHVDDYGRLTDEGGAIGVYEQPGSYLAVMESLPIYYAASGDTEYWNILDKMADQVLYALENPPPEILPASLPFYNTALIYGLSRAEFEGCVPSGTVAWAISTYGWAPTYSPASMYSGVFAYINIGDFTSAYHLLVDPGSPIHPDRLPSLVSYTQDNPHHSGWVVDLSLGPPYYGYWHDDSSLGYAGMLYAGLFFAGYYDLAAQAEPLLDAMLEIYEGDFGVDDLTDPITLDLADLLDFPMWLMDMTAFPGCLPDCTYIYAPGYGYPRLCGSYTTLMFVYLISGGENYRTASLNIYDWWKGFQNPDGSFPYTQNPAFGPEAIATCTAGSSGDMLLAAGLEATTVTSELTEASFTVDHTRSGVRLDVSSAEYDAAAMGAIWSMKCITEHPFFGFVGSYFRPSTSFSAGTGKTAVLYFDITSGGFTGGDATITVSYDHSEVSAAGVEESSLTLHYWDGSSWLPLSNQGLDTVNNRAWGELPITALAGTPIGAGGLPPNSVETATNTGTATLFPSSGTIENLTAMSESELPAEAAATMPNLDFPHGFFSFNVTGLTPGQAVDLTITLPDPVPVGTQYWKYGPTPGNHTPHWYQLLVGDNDGDNVITITLVDGGLGDDWWVADSMIIDQGGPGSPPAAAGCFIATAAYGTSTAEELDTLRAFRDEVLLESTLGSQLVEWYYQTSPPVADFISENSLLRTLVREVLVDPVAWLVEATEAIWGN